MKKLTQRQKKILLISVISFFLVLVGVTSVVLIANKKEKSLQVPKKNNINLINSKNEIITNIEKKLNSDSIKHETLLQELKNENLLKTGETN